MTPRDRILARRAAFVAAAVGALVPEEARADCPETPGGECDVPKTPPPPMVPPVEPPRVCLSPAEPPPAARDGLDLAFALPLPVVFVPTKASDDPTQATTQAGTVRLGLTTSLFAQRDLPRGALRFGVRGGVGGPTADAAWPLGGFVGYVVDVFRKPYTKPHVFVGLEVGGGAFLGEATRPYAEVAFVPIGVALGGRLARQRWYRRTSYALELRGTLLFVDTGPADARTFGPAAVTLGLSFTMGFELVRPHHEYDHASVGGVGLGRRGGV